MRRIDRGFKDGCRKSYDKRRVQRIKFAEIPFYQRAYVWGEEQWERFLGDMEFVTASRRPYFLGSIILKQASSGNTWSEVSEVRTVIDGQQRLTTMVLVLKALCAKIDADRLFERILFLKLAMLP